MNASSVGDELDTVAHVREIARARLRGELMRPRSHMHQRFAAERLNEIDRGIERGLPCGRRRLGAKVQVFWADSEDDICRTARRRDQPARQGD